MKLFTPGPIAMDKETMAIGGQQAQYFRTPAFSSLMLECDTMLKKVLDAPEDSRNIFLTASGTAAMEATVMNLLTDQDRVLVLNGGTFGERFAQICQVHSIPTEVIKLAWDEEFEVSKLEEHKNVTAMLVNVCETSTGRLYPLQSISAFCKKHNIMLVLDAISSFLCDPFSMKESGASAVIISSQKGFGLDPGLSFVTITKEAFEKRVANNEVKSVFFNFNNYYPEILRGQTPYTPAVGIINQLHDKLKRILTEGVESYTDHCAKLASYFREEIGKLKEFKTVNYPLSNCVTPVVCKKANAKELVTTLRDKHDIYVVPAWGNLADTTFRVAHMSRQLSLTDIDELVALLQKLSEETEKR